ncbi:MAG: flagellar motor protein MotB [Inhella sp.]
MAGDAKKLQPIIVKKVKKGGHGAHGGAWKIAYADFVTAMMAFFLLMWLLGSTTEGDRKGIQDYFQSPLKIAMLGGTGAGDASSIVKGGGDNIMVQGGQVKKGEIEADKRSYNLRALKEQQRRAERARLEQLMQKVEEAIRLNPRLAQLGGQIKLELTKEGLRIQIVDEGNRPMFDSGSAIVKPYMRELLQELGAVLAEVPNRLTVEGHTDAKPFAGGERGYSNWELSADRANASRREMVAGGLPEARMLRVQGLASSKLLDVQAPDSAVNRRISIIVMNRDAEDAVLKNLPDEEEAPLPPTDPASA